jgi:hypothetical protein
VVSTPWHIAVGGKSEGPMTIEQLAEGVSSGKITPTTQVWSAGMPAWTPAAQVPALSTLFANAAPPPPPPPQ